MAYTYDKRNPADLMSGRTGVVAARGARPAYAGIPNSAMLSLYGLPEQSAGADLASVMRAKIAALHRQIPSAEAEADRLSAGVTATAPDALRQEMGRRLGADFSGVRFHTDDGSAAKADRMGARAWTRGGDVYFGTGGFDPAVAAHELVHTVQQGAVEGAPAGGAAGAVSESAPMGAVQMWPWSKETKEEKEQRKQEKTQQRLDRMFQIQAGLNAGDPNLVSKKDRKWYEKKLRSGDSDLIQAILQSRDASAVEVTQRRESLVGADSDKLDYQTKGSNSAFNMEIYHQLSDKMTGNKNFQKAFRNYTQNRSAETAQKMKKAYQILGNKTYDKTAEGKALDPTLRNLYKQRSEFIYKNYDKAQPDPQGDNLLYHWGYKRNNAPAQNAPAQNAQNNGAAQQQDMLEGWEQPEREQIGPRAYEMTEEQLKKNAFNPANDQQLAKMQKEIDDAETPEKAFEVFSRLAGNPNAKLRDKDKREGWKLDQVDPVKFKAKLKNMMRMVQDYPELKGAIGDFQQVEKEELADSANMAAVPEENGTNTIQYNAFRDSPAYAPFREATAKVEEKKGKRSFLSASVDYSGNHELGHVLNMQMLRHKGWKNAVLDMNSRYTANSMVLETVKKTLPQKDLQKLKFHQVNSGDEKTGYNLRGQLDTDASELNKLDATSKYGQQNAAEFFAEAFADVYQHGEKARPASIELVKLYEKRRDEIKASLNQQNAQNP